MTTPIEVHADAMRQATHERQIALSAPDLTQAAAKQADIERHRRAYASALANGISPLLLGRRPRLIKKPDDDVAEPKASDAPAAPPRRPPGR